MSPKDLKERTAKFALGVVRFCAPLFGVLTTRSIADQLLRAGTAVDANYGSAQCARSHKEFVAKLGVVVDDVNEAEGWLELLRDSTLVDTSNELTWLVGESQEFTKIFARSFSTARRRLQQRQEEVRLQRPHASRLRDGR